MERIIRDQLKAAREISRDDILSNNKLNLSRVDASLFGQRMAIAAIRLNSALDGTLTFVLNSELSDLELKVDRILDKRGFWRE